MARNNHKILPAFSDPDDYLRMRDVLESAGYQDKKIIETLRIKGFTSLRTQDLPILLRLTENGTRLDTLIRLFLMEIPVKADAVAQAIQPMTLETWMEAGLLEREGDRIAAQIKLLPFNELLVAFDPDRSTGQENYVMGIGSSSLTLANITVRRQGVRTLDLGTGCGIQAFLAAAHSDSVAALDKNPRAVAMTQFNARINGLRNMTCLEGDLFVPVAGRKFNLIISNPPFVISPDRRYIYRDSGMEDDQICQTIARRAPDFLEEGGFCQMLCNWVEYDGQDWKDRLSAWFAGSGCDVWVIHSESRQAEIYASTWIRHTERHDEAGFGGRFEEWMAYYEQRGIKSIAAGVIMMRRNTSGSNWIRMDDAPEKMIGPCGDSVLRGFEAMDFLQTVRDDAAMLGCCFRVAPDVRLYLQYQPGDGGWSVVDSNVRLSTGFAYNGQTDPAVANLLAACNGTSTLGEIIGRTAAQLGDDSRDTANRLAGIVRRLVRQGFLIPA